MFGKSSFAGTGGSGIVFYMRFKRESHNIISNETYATDCLTILYDVINKEHV